MNADLLKTLNVSTVDERLSNLREAVPFADYPEPVPQYINNHIHTFYSFSPYSPTAAVYAAKEAGLCTAGIVDHDTMAGAREFLAAAKLLDMPSTIGMECRVSFADTAFSERRLNNPDQVGVAYMTIQSVPHKYIEVLTDFFAPYRKARGERNRGMVSRLNDILPDLALHYETDVLPLSKHAEGGAVTERHLLYALAKKMTKTYGEGKCIPQKLEDQGIALSEKQRTLLSDPGNPYYEYDLLGVLKSAFVERIYIDAKEECPPLSLIVEKCKEWDAHLAYAYLGDVGDSVTGDKKTQQFEDAYLDELFKCLIEQGVRAVTYMPTRNTREQLVRLRALCEQYDMFQISGEDINSPRQLFVTRAMEDPFFANLIEATWKLIEHEAAADA